jgi:hypothetical protein
VLQSAAMARKDRIRTGPAARMAVLLDGGDHRAAADAARAVLADPDAGAPDRDAARAVLASLRPEPGAVAAGLAAVAVAVAVALWTVLRAA